MLVLLRASADSASPISRLRPRPVPLMVAAAEEPVLRPQLMGAAALTGTATGVAVSGFKVAALGLAAALYAGPLALPELPGSELGPYVLVRPHRRHHCRPPAPLPLRTPNRLHVEMPRSSTAPPVVCTSASCRCPRSVGWRAARCVPRSARLRTSRAPTWCPVSAAPAVRRTCRPQAG